MNERKPKQSILQKTKQSVLAPQSRLSWKADVVFVLDRSGSMSPIFHRVRDWIAGFVAGVGSDGAQSVRVRYGFLCYNAQEFHRLDEHFTESSSRFGDAIRSIGSSDIDEVSLPAIDAAADFPWNEDSHRFLIVLTDEATATGYDPAWQNSQIDALRDKLIRLRIKLWLAAPECPIFRKLTGIPHFDYRVVAGHAFEDPTWLTNLMRQLGNKVSVLSRTSVDASMSVRPDLYDLSGTGIQIRTV